MADNLTFIESLYLLKYTYTYLGHTINGNENKIIYEDNKKKIKDIITGNIKNITSVINNPDLLYRISKIILYLHYLFDYDMATKDFNILELYNYEDCTENIILKTHGLMNDKKNIIITYGSRHIIFICIENKYKIFFIGNEYKTINGAVSIDDIVDDRYELFSKIINAKNYLNINTIYYIVYNFIIGYIKFRLRNISRWEKDEYDHKLLETEEEIKKYEHNKVTYSDNNELFNLYQKVVKLIKIKNIEDEFNNVIYITTYIFIYLEKSIDKFCEYLNSCLVKHNIFNKKNFDDNMKITQTHGYFEETNMTEFYNKIKYKIPKIKLEDEYEILYGAIYTNTEINIDIKKDIIIKMLTNKLLDYRKYRSDGSVQFSKLLLYNIPLAMMLFRELKELNELNGLNGGLNIFTKVIDDCVPEFEKKIYAKLVDIYNDANMYVHDKNIYYIARHVYDYCSKHFMIDPKFSFIQFIKAFGTILFVLRGHYKCKSNLTITDQINATYHTHLQRIIKIDHSGRENIYFIQTPYEIIMDTNTNIINVNNTTFSKYSKYFNIKIDCNKYYNFNIYLLNNPFLLYNIPNDAGYNVSTQTNTYSILNYVYNFIMCHIEVISDDQKKKNKIYILQYVYKKYNYLQKEEQKLCIKIILILSKFGSFDEGTFGMDVDFEDISIVPSKYMNAADIINTQLKLCKNEDDFVNMLINYEDDLLGILPKYVNIIKRKTINLTQCEDDVYYYMYEDNNVTYKYTLLKGEKNILGIRGMNEWKFVLEKCENKPFAIVYNIYCILNDDIIKFNVKDAISKEDHVTINNVVNIYVNDCKVLKYSEICHMPFIYIYPFNVNYTFVYKKNNMYYMTYLIDVTYTKIYTFSINPNNNMFVNKLNNSDQQMIEEICKKYGFNKYNIYFERCNLNKPIPPKHDINSNNDENDIKSNIPYQDFMNISLIDNYEENYSINLLGENVIDENYIMYGEQANSSHLDKKLLQKIKKLVITDIGLFKNVVAKMNTKIEQDIIDLQKSIVQLFQSGTMYCKIFTNEYNVIHKYTLSLRYNNILKEIQKIDENITGYTEIVSSLIKIYIEKMNTRTYKLNYVFERIFEIIFGNFITDEQYETYSKIINMYLKHSKQSLYITQKSQKKNKDANNFNIFNFMKPTHQGGAMYLPIHHLMMGKGKSSVITPLLCLYFNLVLHKKIIVIVPQHLKLQTINSLTYYITFFNINVEIMTDTEVKMKYLAGEYTGANEMKNKDYVMLIDEFDSILNPLASNFNYIKDNNKDVTKLYTYIYKIFIHGDVDDNGDSDIDGVFNKRIIKDEMINMFRAIDGGLLVENINWGINPKTCLALPYFGKDTYDEKCLFTSPIITIYLTLYYFITLKQKKLTILMYDYIIENNLSNDIFSVQQPPTYETAIQKFCIDNCLLKKILDIIIGKIKLTQTQLNISFIDILNIKNMYKVGYSGTVNIDLPVLSEQFEFDKIVVDNDEKANVEYAIKKATIINYDSGKNIYNKINELIIKNSYGALIDATGAFKNDKNIEIAKMIYTAIIRPVIFLDEKNNKLVYMGDNNVEKYDEYINYINPFLYYSQSHIVGVDIKQDNYPNIIGLCIIDLNMQYTVIAQAIFRLRKLNMGHTINFYINGTGKIGGGEELIKLLHENDDVSKKNKKSYLLLQNIKTLIRRDLIDKGTLITVAHLENTQYYFNLNYDNMTFMNVIKNINSLYNVEDSTINKYATHIKLNSDIGDIKNKIINIVINISITQSDDIVLDNQIDQQNEIGIQAAVNKDALDIQDVFEPYYKMSENILLEPNFDDATYCSYFLSNMTIVIDTLNNNKIYSFCNMNLYSKFVENNYDFYTNFIYVYLNENLILVPITYMMYLYNINFVFDMSLVCLNCDFKDGYVQIQEKYKHFNCIKLMNGKRVDNVTSEFRYLLNLLRLRNYNADHIYSHLFKKKEEAIFNKVDKLFQNKFNEINDKYKQK